MRGGPIVPQALRPKRIAPFGFCSSELPYVQFYNFQILEFWEVSELNIANSRSSTVPFSAIKPLKSLLWKFIIESSPIFFPNKYSKS
jgi:hypothetical protein